MSERLSTYSNINLNKTGVAVLAKGGKVKGFNLFNGHATAIRYMKFYDQVAAPASTDTPKLTIGLPASKSVDLSFGGDGITFANGIGVRAVTGVAENDNTDPGANEVVVDVYYVPNMP
jgi:hypothetical protein